MSEWAPGGMSLYDEILPGRGKGVPPSHLLTYLLTYVLAYLLTYVLTYLPGRGRGVPPSPRRTGRSAPAVSEQVSE